MPDLNQRPTHYECVALPTELMRHLKAISAGALIAAETGRFKCGKRAGRAPAPSDRYPAPGGGAPQGGVLPLSEAIMPASTTPSSAIGTLAMVAMLRSASSSLRP